jgi:UDP-hydrolysing UDP-N-acetyl-D-glucosamine 2-epimerase
MSTKIAYVTTARSDYGPSFWLIHDLFADSRFEVGLVVGGSHLSKTHGNTVKEIEEDGWPIAARIPFLRGKGDDRSLGIAAGRALAGFAEFFANYRPDIVIVYGDRYELLPIAGAAVITRTPLAHLCGGDITEGAIDDQVRHAVTKLSHLHFPSTKRSAERIRQMGEEPWRIHQVGDPALDHILRSDHASADELTQHLGFVPDRNTLLVTFHPVTLELEQMPIQVRELAEALRAYEGHVVITAPAPDPGGDVVRKALEALVRLRPKTILVENLGSHRYRGLLRLVGAMVGNSSSGLIEACSVPLPVVNIGARQNGRERAANVLDVPPKRNAILSGIAQVLSPSFGASLISLMNPYGDGHTSQRVVTILGNLPSRQELMTKRFSPI